MARRRLESAVQAGRSIDLENDWRSKLGSGDCVRELLPPADREGVFSLQYSFDGQVLAVGYGNAAVDIIDAVTGDVINPAVKPRHGGLAVTALRFSPKQQRQLYSSSSDGTVHVTNIDTEECKLVIEEKGNEINCMDFSRDGCSLATAGRDLNVRIYDSGTSQLSRKFDGFRAAVQLSDEGPNAHSSRVFALRWHPEYDHIFISAGWDDSIKIWDCRTAMGVVRSISGPHVCGDSLDVRGYRILSGSWKGQDSLQIWDYSEGKLLQTVPFIDSGDGEFLYCAQFVNDVCVAAGGSGTSSVQVIDTTTSSCVATLHMCKPVQALDSTLGGARLAVGDAESIVKMVNIE